MVATHEHFRPSIKEVFRQPKKVVDMSGLLPRDTEAKKPSIFSLSDAYSHYKAFRDTLSPAQANERSYSQIWMYLRSIRFEATAQPVMKTKYPLTDDLVTRVEYSSTGQLVFSNRNHADGHDLVEKYRNSLTTMTGYQRYRYDLENQQSIDVWRAASGILLNPEFLSSDSSEETIRHLLSQGFSKTKQEASAGLISAFPNIEQISGAKKIEMLMGPPLITASPPTEIHYQGRSSFIWISRLVYLPAVNEFIVLQKGLFSGYQLPEVNFFLGYPDQKTTPFPSEEAIMSFINCLPPEFVAQHAETIFEEIIKNLGHFTALPPIDENIKLGTLELSDYAQTVLQLLEWEYQNCQKNPKLLASMEARFKEWEETILHSVAGGFDDLNLDKLLASYVETFENPEIAANPYIYNQKINDALNAAYPNRGIKLDLTLFDCITGPKLFGLNTLTSGLKLDLGALQLQLISERKKGIRSQADLEKLCKKWGLDPDLFKPNESGRVCPGCKLIHEKDPKINPIPDYIGPCVCFFCHVEDNLGLHDQAVDVPENPKSTEPELKLLKRRKYRSRAGLTELMNNDIYSSDYELYVAGPDNPNLPQAKAS